MMQTLEAQTEDVPLFLNAHEAVELNRCEGVVEKGLAAFLDVGQALWQIRQSRLYRERFDTFEEYVEQRWHMSKSSAYRVISATEIVQQLEASYLETNGSPVGDAGEHLLPVNEAQARPLAQLAEHQRAGAWAAAVEKAGGQPTAAVVQEVVAGMLPPKLEKVDSVAAPLFDMEDDAAGQSGFVPPAPAPLNTQGGNPKPGNMTDEEWEASAKPFSAAEPLSAADTLTALNQERDETVAGWTESKPPAQEQAELVTSTLDTKALVDTEALRKVAETIDAVEVAPVHSAPAAKPSAPAQPETNSKPGPAPAVPALPAGMISTIVKEADFKQAQEMGLWPPAFAIRTVHDLEAHIKAMDARETPDAPASNEAPAPPSQAMIVAGVSATRLAEINATGGGSILYYAETQLLNELFPKRETTGPDHIVAVLVTARLREMTAKASEESN